MAKKPGLCKMESCSNTPAILKHKRQEASTQFLNVLAVEQIRRLTPH